MAVWSYLVLRGDGGGWKIGCGKAKKKKMNKCMVVILPVGTPNTNNGIIVLKLWYDVRRTLTPTTVIPSHWQDWPTQAGYAHRISSIKSVVQVKPDPYGLMELRSYASQNPPQCWQHHISFSKGLIHLGPTNNTPFDEAAPANNASSVWNAHTKDGLVVREACNSPECKQDVFSQLLCSPMSH